MTNDLKSIFEQWVQNSGDPDYEDYLQCDEDGHYRLSATSAGFAAWQAAFYIASCREKALIEALKQVYKIAHDHIETDSCERIYEIIKPTLKELGIEG